MRGVADPSSATGESCGASRERSRRKFTRTNERPTKLADVLVRHEEDYKTALDTVRIACANVESELGALLAEHLRKPAEAKRALANLFAAPGSVAVGAKAIVVTLQPAGTRNEREAFGRLPQVANAWRLALPAHPVRRTLRFRSPD